MAGTSKVSNSRIASYDCSYQSQYGQGFSFVSMLAMAETFDFFNLTRFSSPFANSYKMLRLFGNLSSAFASLSVIEVSSCKHYNNSPIFSLISIMSIANEVNLCSLLTERICPRHFFLSNVMVWGTLCAQR